MSTDTTAPERAAPAQAKRPTAARNVAANWMRELITVASGFVLPRLIDGSMGPVELGIWDFGWSARSIVGFTQLGMGASSGHHTARFSATQDWDRLNRTLGGTLALVVYTCVLTVGATAAAIALTPTLLGTDYQSHALDAQFVVGAMGAAVVLQMITMVWGGVVVGHHRFDLLNLAEISADMVMVAGLLSSVLLGWGLRVMGLFVVIRQVVDMAIKMWTAYRVCPDLRIRPRWTDKATFKEVVQYGVKVSFDGVANLIYTQAALIVLMTVHGPATVALFARPRNLMQMTRRFLMGYSRVIMPRAGRLKEIGDKQGLQKLLVRATQISLYLALPISGMLMIQGGPLLRLWMGDRYAHDAVMILLGVGYVPLFTQQATWSLLLGLGAHGVASVAGLIGAVVCAGLSVLFVGVLDWGVSGAAMAIAIPLATVNLFVLPYSGCRTTGLSISRLFREGMLEPLRSAVGYLLVLGACRFAFRDQPLVGLGCSAMLGGAVLTWGYWNDPNLASVRQTMTGWIRARR